MENTSDAAAATAKARDPAFATNEATTSDDATTTTAAAATAKARDSAVAISEAAASDDATPKARDPAVATNDEVAASDDATTPSAAAAKAEARDPATNDEAAASDDATTPSAAAAKAEARDPTTNDEAAAAAATTTKKSITMMKKDASMTTAAVATTARDLTVTTTEAATGDRRMMKKDASTPAGAVSVSIKAAPTATTVSGTNMKNCEDFFTDDAVYNLRNSIVESVLTNLKTDGEKEMNSPPPFNNDAPLWISDFCSECVSMLSDLIERNQDLLFERREDGGPKKGKIKDTKKAARCFLESCRLQFSENVSIEVFNSLGVKDCLGYVGGIPLSIARLFEHCYGHVLEKIIGKDMNAIANAPAGLVYDADSISARELFMDHRTVSLAELIRSATDTKRIEREGHWNVYPGICSCSSMNSEEGFTVDAVDTEGLIGMVDRAELPASANNGIGTVTYKEGKTALNDFGIQRRVDDESPSQVTSGDSEIVFGESKHEHSSSEEPSEESHSDDEEPAEEVNFDTMDRNRPSNLSFGEAEESRGFSSCLGLCKHPVGQCSLGEINALRLLETMLLAPKLPSDGNACVHFDVEFEDLTVGEYVLVSGKEGRRPSFSIGSAVFEASAFSRGVVEEDGSEDANDKEAIARLHRQIISDFKEEATWISRELTLVCCQRFCKPDARVFICVHTSASPMSAIKVAPMSDVKRETKYGSFRTIRMPLSCEFSGRANDSSRNWRSILYTNMAKAMLQKAVSSTHRNVVTETPTGWILSPWATQKGPIEILGNVMRPLYAEDGGLGLKWGGYDCAIDYVMGEDASITEAVFNAINNYVTVKRHLEIKKESSYSLLQVTLKNDYLAMIKLIERNEDTEDTTTAMEKIQEKVLRVAQNSFKYEKGIQALERDARTLFEACAAYIPKFFATIKLKVPNGE